MAVRHSWITLPLPLLMLSLSAAHAQEAPKARELVAEPNRPQLAAAAPTPAQAEWQEPDVEIQAWRQLYLNQNGLELRQPLRVGEHRFELGLKGPLMKRKRVGLAFELRF